MHASIQQACFPIVAPDGVDMATLAVEPMQDEGSDRFVRSPQMRSETVAEILIDARAIDRAGRMAPVWVTCDRSRFDGGSFGLALALADRRARLGGGFAPLVATGAIAPGGRGTLAAITDFDAKCAKVADHARASGQAWDFAFPRANLDAAGPETRQVLAEAEAAGTLRLHPADHLADLAHLWGAGRLRPTTLKRAALAGLALAVALGLGFIALRDDPGESCEARAAAIDPERPGAQVAPLLDACTRALAADPGNARLRFLTGQAHALNGSDALAGAEWRKAAEGGDVDGMAAYGRWLWLGNPQDQARIAKAYRWLVRAADAGSATAAEDLASLVLEDSGAAAAEPWFRKARSLREKEEGT